jgi:hypothetical protein
VKRRPPFLAVWCLTRLAGGERGETLIGDLLERFDAGETRAWFWRQSLAALAFSFARAAREHGASFVSALAAAGWILLAMWIVDPWITGKVMFFQTHQMLELDPEWVRRSGWRIAFFTLALLQTCMWFAAVGWLAPRIHRAHPRLIITACAVIVFALHLPLLIHQAGNLMTHARYLDVFIWILARALLAANAVIWFGLWSAKRSTSDAGVAPLSTARR